jgi:hypothetical protein
MRRLLTPFVLVCALAAPAQRLSGGIPRSKIVLPVPAYIGMPIWMQIESPVHYPVRYPSSTSPQDFYCNKVELKRDGVVVPPTIMRGLGAGRVGPPCGWLGIEAASGQLPIHLQYPSLQPGTYMVRFTRYQYGRSLHTEIGEQSDWVPMHVLRPPAETVEDWLTEALSRVPTASGALLGDTLPSLLASRDPRVLQVMVDTTYNINEMVSQYAANALAFFDPEHVRSALILVLRQRAPNAALGYFFASHGDTVKGIVPELLADSLPRLHSADPGEVAGAIQTLGVLRQPYFGLSPADLAKISAALSPAVDVVIAQRNEKGAQSLANLVGAMQLPGGRVLLWKLIEANVAVEQSMICVAGYKDPADLPRLTTILSQYDSDDPHGYKHGGVVDDLGRQYGNATRPYLRELLATSKQTWVKTAAAKGLVLMNDRAGWAFFVNVVNGNEFYRHEMIQWLRATFLELRSADEAVVLNFLEARLAASPAA